MKNRDFRFFAERKDFLPGRDPGKLAASMKFDDKTLRAWRLDESQRWATLAVLAWGVTLAALAFIFLFSPERVTGFAPYLKGAQRWLDGAEIYSFKPNKGFVYSPTIAVFFSVFAGIPVFLANILWRWLSAGILLGGLWAVFRSGPFAHVPRHLRGLVCLLVLPMASGNLDSGQANPIVAGLLMVAVAAACVDRWWIAAIAVAGAFYWKVYPLTLGLLLILAAPGKFTWRLVLAMVLFGLLPFLFQKPDYALEQYRQWVVTRLADNRFAYPLEIAPLDLWFLLVRLAHLPLSVTVYNVLRVLAGAAIAAFCLYGKWKDWPRERILGGIFSFSCVWMLLFGPASESLTYLILVPATAIAVVESFSERMPPAARMAALLGYGLLLLAILRVGFFHRLQSPWVLAIQPFGAIAFLCYCLTRYLDNRWWRGTKTETKTASLPRETGEPGG